jgi:adenosyl cobinamide kinase/adenosyl cobinamide phosphate guanylyltransferase
MTAREALAADCMNSVFATPGDLQGWANQILAEEAESVTLVVAGLPLALKGERRTFLREG